MNWIKITDRTPPELIGLALLYVLDGDTETNWVKGYYMNGYFYADGNKPFKYDVIAWMRPDLPLSTELEETVPLENSDDDSLGSDYLTDDQPEDRLYE